MKYDILWYKNIFFHTSYASVSRMLELEVNEGFIDAAEDNEVLYLTLTAC